MCQVVSCDRSLLAFPLFRIHPHEVGDRESERGAEISPFSYHGPEEAEIADNGDT